MFYLFIYVKHSCKLGLSYYLRVMDNADKGILATRSDSALVATA